MVVRLRLNQSVQRTDKSEKGICLQIEKRIQTVKQVPFYMYHSGLDSAESLYHPSSHTNLRLCSIYHMDGEGGK